MEMMDKMMESMMSGMSKEEKEEMMGKMMEKFFAGMTAEDKQKMMEQMMPKMMEGVNMMDMMPKMMMGMMSGGEIDVDAKDARNDALLFADGATQYAEGKAS